MACLLRNLAVLRHTPVPTDPDRTAPLVARPYRENMIRVWHMLMPEPVFAEAKQLIQKAVGDEWAELTRRITDMSL